MKRAADLNAALDDAFQYDRKALIEASCEGRELECAVLGNDRPEASVPGEVLVKGAHEFYDYESKYVDPEGSATKIPADMPAAKAKKLRAMAVAAFKALSLRGMARVDFLASRDLREIYVNEVNTIPGFTSISMYPKLWEASGLPLPKLIDRLIELALEEHRERESLKITYQPKPAPRSLVNEPMRRLLIATTNPAKLAEYRLILRDIGIELELVSLADVGISESSRGDRRDLHRERADQGALLFRSRANRDAGRRRRPRDRRARRGAGRPVASMARFGRRRFRRGAGRRSYPADEGRRGGAADGANSRDARADTRGRRRCCARRRRRAQSRA